MSKKSRQQREKICPECGGTRRHRVGCLATGSEARKKPRTLPPYKYERGDEYAGPKS